MDYLPVFLHLRNEPCLVIGGGDVAYRKIRTLLKTGARITVVAESASNEIRELAAGKALRLIEDKFVPEQVEGMRIVIAATDDQDINRRASATAVREGVPVNVVDQPELCSFIVPSIVDRSPVLIAVGTGGAAPILSRLLKSRLETMIPGAYGRLASLANAFRARAKSAYTSPAVRRAFWEHVLQGPIAELVFAGRDKEARSALAELLENPRDNDHRQGEVYLVGAGPGDPDLLTFRALRLMQQADVVLYDRLVAAEIVDLVRRDAERIYVGKARANHRVPQQDINHLLVELAKQGQRVLRLKGGDPFIFGRGGEEIEDLVRENIPFQVIPGITAASGCASYTGIPLTHRDYAQSCTFVTGHLKNDVIDLDWQMLSRPRQTVVVYMSLTGLESVCQALIEHGSSADRPAALIQQGTTRNQKVITGTLGSLPSRVAGEDIEPPTLLIIGDVVRLHETLGWYRPDSEQQNLTAETGLRPRHLHTC